VSLKLTVCPARAVPRLKHNSVAAELDIVRHFGDRPLAEMNFFWTPGATNLELARDAINIRA
jgi:hypothetical protein